MTLLTAQNLETIRNLILNKAELEKNVAWASKDRFEGGILSVSKILNAMQMPFDQVGAAEKASLNPRHEHFGKTVEQIIAIWNTKVEHKSGTGIGLDTYAQSVLRGAPMDLEAIVDPALRSRCEQFKKFHDEFIVPNEIMHVGCEIKLASPSLGFSGRLDWLGLKMVEGKPKFIIFDWKQNDKISDKGFMDQRLLPPFDHMQDCKLTRFTNQLHLYRYFFEVDCDVSIGGTLVGHFLQDDYRILRGSHQYDPKLVESIVRFSRSKLK